MDLTIKSIPNKFYIGESPQNMIGEIDYYVDEKNRIVVSHTYVKKRNIEVKG
jgi:predicted GNAT family acetyltransferase